MLLIRIPSLQLEVSMRLAGLIAAALLSLFAGPGQASCLSEVAAFAEEICGALNKKGSQRLVQADGKLSADIGGIIKRFAGSFEAQGQAKIFEETYENVLRSELPGELADIRRCKVNMVQVAREEICAD